MSALVKISRRQLLCGYFTPNTLPGRELTGADPTPALGPERVLGSGVDLLVLASLVIAQ